MALKSSFGWMGALTIGIVLFATGCAGTAHVEKDKTVKLSDYKTYGWLEKAKPKKGKANHRDDLVEQNIRNSVNEQLQKKGYVESATAPDLLISSDLLIERSEKEQQEARYSQPYSRDYYNPRTRRISTMYFPSQFLGYENYSTTVKEGTVTVTMIDAKTDKAVWQGWATRELLRNRVTSKDIDKNVRSIFNKFEAE